MLAQAIRKKLGKAGKEEKGFTLIELLAVIVILGIIAVIAIPMIGNIISKSKTDADLATARQIYDAARLFVTAENNGTFSGTIIIKDTVTTTKDLTQNGYLEANIYLPSNKELITGGTVVFGTDGTLTNVNINTATTFATAAKTFVGADVLKQ